MTRIGQYLSTELLPGFADKWRVLTNRGEELGRVEWFSRWRQYTFNPAPNTTFNAQCQRDLAAFLERINQEAMREREAKRGKSKA